MKFFFSILIFLIACSTSTTSIDRGSNNDDVSVEQPPLKIEYIKNPTINNLVRINGGSLTSPLSIPLWGEVDSVLASMKFSDASSLLSFTHDVFKFDETRIYIHQSEMFYLGHSECRFYNVNTQQFEKVESCLSSPTGGRSDIQSLGNSLFFVYGYMEGGGEGNIIRWDGTPKNDLLLAHLSVPTSIKIQSGNFIIESHCHPKNGTVPEITWSNGDCQSDSNDCGYCATMFGKTFLWNWNPKTDHIQFLRKVESDVP